MVYILIHCRSQPCQIIKSIRKKVKSPLIHKIGSFNYINKLKEIKQIMADYRCTMFAPLIG